MIYDSNDETKAHIARVRALLSDVISNFQNRSNAHDKSKLLPPEKEMFDLATGRLKGCTYGSDEYKGFLKELKPALDHHYANNSHHPEHFQDGVRGMTLLDLIEMLCDWKAAGERHADGSMQRSLTLNQERFSISRDLQQILTNTARELGFPC